MNTVESPEWETASSLLAELRAVMQNQTLSVDDMVSTFNSFDFSLLQNASVVIRRAAVLKVMVLLKLILTRQEQRSKVEQLSPENRGEHIVNIAQKKLFQLRSVRCQPILGPIFVDEDQTFVLHATNSFVKSLSKSQIKRFVSDRQYFSYLLQRTDGSTIQLGLEKDRGEAILQNPSLVQTIPDPLEIQIFTTVSTFGKIHQVFPIQFIGITSMLTSLTEQQESDAFHESYSVAEAIPKMRLSESFESLENLQSPSHGPKSMSIHFSRIQHWVHSKAQSEMKGSTCESTRESCKNLRTCANSNTKDSSIASQKVQDCSKSGKLISRPPTRTVGRQHRSLDVKPPKLNSSSNTEKAGFQLSSSSKRNLRISKSPGAFSLSKCHELSDSPFTESSSKHLRPVSANKSLLRTLASLPIQAKSSSNKNYVCIQQAQFSPPSGSTQTIRKPSAPSLVPRVRFCPVGELQPQTSLQTVPKAKSKGFFVVRSDSKKKNIRKM